MNKIGLGTVQFGIPYGISNERGLVPSNEIKSIIKIAKTNGIRLLDTAVNYGKSQSRLGNVGVKEFDIISKLPPIKDTDINIESWVKGEVLKSLKELNVKQLWGLLLHNPEDLYHEKGEMLYNTITELKLLGYIKNFGVSIYSIEQLAKLYNDFKFDIVQAPFNILDQRLYRSGWLEKLYENNVYIHVRSIFLQGLLLMDYNKRPKYFNKWDYLWQNWYDWLKEEKLKPLNACLQFVYNFPQISNIIIGVESSNQLQQILNIPMDNYIIPPETLFSEDKDLINPIYWPN